MPWSGRAGAQAAVRVVRGRAVAWRVARGVIDLASESLALHATLPAHTHAHTRTHTHHTHTHTHAYAHAYAHVHRPLVLPSARRSRATSTQRRR